MALTVEDGTGVENANSYVDLTYARAYAAQRTLALPADDVACEALLIKAMDFIESEARGPYKGSQTYPGVDNLKWPREGVVINDAELAPNKIPATLKKAVAQLAIEIQAVDPIPTLSGQVVKREKVDVLETEYAIDYKAGQKPPVMTKVDLLLAPLLRRTGVLQVKRA